MKSNHILLALLGLLVLFALVSCATAPPAVEPAPPPPEETRPAPPVAPPAAPPVQAADQATLNALNEAAARAEAARNFVKDFRGDEFLPSEWESANSLHTQAEQQRSAASQAAAQESAARFNRAADAFEAMRDNAIAQYYENKANELVNARNAAVNAGAQIFVPDFLLEVDNVVVRAEDLYNAGDIFGAKNASDEALSMYIALRTGLEAYKLREEIAEIAERHAPEAWAEALAEADVTGLNAIDKWEAGDYNDARIGAEAALLLYLRIAATAERQRALDVRADIAVRQEFNAAQEIFMRANSAFMQQWSRDATVFFSQSRSMFKEAADTALQRRIAAEEALRRADERLEESDATARDAEAILQGGIQ
jgi:hypothetical protein